MKKYYIFLTLICIYNYTADDLSDLQNKLERLSIEQIENPQVNEKDIPQDVINNEEIFKAVKENDIEKVRTLLMNNNAFANASIKQYSILHYAVGNENIEIIQLLLQYGANVNAQDRRGVTPLMKNKNKKVADLLLSYGADKTLTNKSGLTTRQFIGNMAGQDLVKYIDDFVPDKGLTKSAVKNK
jgi:ankyrin repeat protein